MNLRRILLGLLGLAIVLVGFGIGITHRKGGDASKVTVTNLYLNWIFTSSFAGDVLAADKFAPRYGLKIELQVGGEGRDPIKLVRDGDFGVAAADEVIRAVDKGAPIVIVGVLNDETPAAFAALVSSGIRTPKDFEGKRVGILPFGATGLVYQSLLKQAGVDRSKIREIVISGDLRPFISGNVNDVQPVFLYDEPVSLEEQHIAINLIYPHQYGVDFKGQVYFTTRTTLTDHPELVRNFLSSVMDGWLAARSNPVAALDSLKSHSPSLDPKREEVRLRRALPFFVPNDQKEILNSKPQSWAQMLQVLSKAHVTSRQYMPSEFMDLSEVQRAYDSRKPD